MKQVTAEKITKTYGEKELFRNLDFTIGENQKIGLIGLNGTGKSSLLSVVAEMDEPDSGAIIKPSGYSVEFVQQQTELVPGKNVLEQVFMNETPETEAIKAYELSLARLQDSPDDEKIQGELAEAQVKMDTLDAWELNAAAKAILTKLGVYNFEKIPEQLSGGEKKRVLLASSLIRKPDLLILDEPTNHLDIGTIRWLEEYLKGYQASFIVVTHDRYFLDSVTDTIWELDGGSLYTYKGNYEAFLGQKAEREENEARRYEKQQSILKKEIEWLKKGAKARTTKQKARIQRIEQMKEQKGPIDTGSVDIALSGSRIGKRVFELEDTAISIGGEDLIEPFSYIVQPGARIGIIGPNGSGKSTFLKMLAGDIDPSSGRVITGNTVNIGFYTQESEDMDGSMRVIHYIKETAEFITDRDGNLTSAATMLERFLFPPSTHGLPINKLSGGEQRRLYLLKILMENPNVLLLDEPTNDLDIETLTVLEDYLDGFSGAVITVSHDRYFLDRTSEILFVFGNGSITPYYGSYSDYLEEEQQAAPIPKMRETTSKEKPFQHDGKKKKMSYLEKREWEEIEDRISASEGKIAEIERQIGQSGSDYEKAQELFNDKEELENKLDELMERWAYLSEKADE
ncbi:ABC-F family ATP-binding cassette domain-containing protein [Bacillus marinisedimentorum]|uniref:ABC-F family ATP-binding cassette domain-containing protein n=1 Tax=Bacillus marinisedimentorum TaxID=1821260 RepID=UPI0007DFD119|nr:ABC-F family ATP-binding cassette domain-containing protein [Bacillus marinisedimentorum]